MIIILNISSEKFSLNGIPYFKNFMPHVVAGKLKIVNVYDSKLELTALDVYSNYSVDGVTYTDIAALQNALLPVLYTRNSLNFDSDLPFYNQITKQTGITSTGLNKTFNAGWEWIINNVEYSNTVDITIAFPLASSGKERLDRIVVTNLNTFVRIQGVESISSPTADPRPDNTVDVTFVLVTDTEVGEPTTPVIGPEDLALKLDKGGYIGTAQTLKNDIESLSNDLDDNYYTKPEIDTKIASVYKYKGNVDNYASLPTSGQVIGDVYNALDTDINWAWTGTGWDDLGGVVDVSGKLDKGGYTGTAQTLKNDIDNIYQPNVLISSVAPTRLVNTFTYPATQYTALISGTVRTNPAQFVTTIDVATTDYKRVDLIWFKDDNTLVKTIGTESLTVAERPNIPFGQVGVAVSFINVFGNVVETPVPITNEISIQDSNGIEKFKVPENGYLRFKGVGFNIPAKRIEVDPLVGGTIFVSATGNDTTAELENRNKPFLTINNAILAVPNDGKIWTIWQLDGTQTISTVIPDKNLVFYSNNAVVLNLATGYASTNTVVRYIFDMPYSTINISTNFGAKQACSLIINCNILNQISGSTICFSRIFFLDLKVNTLNLIGQFLDQQTQSGATILNLSIVNLNSTGTCILVSAGNDPLQLINLSIRKTAATGTLLLCGATGKLVTSIGNFTSSSLGNMFNANTNSVYSITFNDSLITNGTIQASNSVNNVTLSGRATYTSGGSYFINFASLFTMFNLDLTLVTSYLCSRLQGAGFVMYSSYITTSLELSAGETIPVAMVRPLLKVYGECTIIKTGATPFFNIASGTTNAYVEEVGTLKINTTYFGANVGRMVTALSFKEKAKEIVIRAKNDIVNKVLDSSTTYIIDGTITLLAGEYIIVPAGGLTITGYGFDASFISKNVSGQSIFSSPAGNSGNLVTRQLTYSPGLGSVFNVTDSDGSHAIEITDVNFQGVTGSSLGILTGYRQFTGTTCGFYSLSDGLILENNWSGFKLTNSNIIGFATTGSLFKKGAATSFSNRFYIDLNLQVGASSVICDFAPANLVNDKSLQVVNCYAKVNGVINDATTATTFPNITPYSSKAYFVNNIGIKNSNQTPYGIDTTNMQTYANDAAAAAGGIIQVGMIYIESATGYPKVRQT